MPGTRRRCCALVAALFVLTSVRFAYPADQPPTFGSSDQAIGVLLEQGYEAADAWQAHARRQRRWNRIGDILAGAFLMSAGLQTTVWGSAGVSTGAFDKGVLYLFVGSGIYVSSAGAVAGEEALSAAIANVGEHQGTFVLTAARGAPEEAIAFCQRRKDPADRARLLTVVMAYAAAESPDLSPRIAKALAEALAEPQAIGPVLDTLDALTPSLDLLGPGDAGVMTLADCMSTILARPDLSERELAELGSTYLGLRPESLPILLSRTTDRGTRMQLGLAAARGWNRRGEVAKAQAAATTAVSEVDQLSRANQKVVALAMAATCTTDPLRESLLERALSLAKADGDKRDSAQLCQILVLTLSEQDIDLGLAMLVRAGLQLSDVRFAEALANFALESGSPEARASVLGSLPESGDLRGYRVQLAASLLGEDQQQYKHVCQQSAEQVLAATKRRPRSNPMKTRFEWRQKNEARKREFLEAMGILAQVNPDRALELLPDQGEDGDLFARSYLRIARVLAQQGVESQSDVFVGRACGLFEEGLRCEPAPERIDHRDGILLELGPMLAAVYASSPEAAVQLAEKAPAGPIRVEALLQCGMLGALDSQQWARPMLDRALSEGQQVGDKLTRQFLTIRSQTGLAILEPDESRRAIDGYREAWMRSASLAALAGLSHREEDQQSWLDVLHGGTAAAGSLRDAEERTKCTGWCLQVAAMRPGEFETVVRNTGLPVLAPLKNLAR